MSTEALEAAKRITTGEWTEGDLQTVARAYLTLTAERDEALAKLAAVRGELKWAIDQNGGYISASGLLALLDVKE
jgi:hypothetical protein